MTSKFRIRDLPLTTGALVANDDFLLIQDVSIPRTSGITVNEARALFGSSGGGSWGSITGNLSNQTDLTVALGLKANNTDVTSNVSALNTNITGNVSALTVLISGKQNTGNYATNTDITTLQTSIGLKANTADVYQNIANLQLITTGATSNSVNNSTAIANLQLITTGATSNVVNVYAAITSNVSTLMVLKANNSDVTANVSALNSSITANVSALNITIGLKANTADVYQNIANLQLITVGTTANVVNVYAALSSNVSALNSSITANVSALNTNITSNVSAMQLITTGATSNAVNNSTAIANLQLITTGTTANVVNVYAALSSNVSTLQTSIGLKANTADVTTSLALKQNTGNYLAGPSSSTANGIPRFNGATGLVLQDSGITIDASNNLTLQTNSAIFWSTDLSLYRDAAGVFAQRNGVNGQVYNMYNTYTDASNYERGFMGWVANVFEIGTQKAGTGATRTVRIRQDGTDAIFINTSGVSFGMRAFFGNNTGPDGMRRAVIARTSDGTESSSGYFVTNRGAAATVTRTLQTYTDNMIYTRVASFAFRIAPSAGKKFLRQNGTLEAADKYLELQSNGATIEVIYDGTDYVILRESGTIAVQP